MVKTRCEASSLANLPRARKVLASLSLCLDRLRETKAGRMRVYLVIIDESAEAGVALRYAARRAAKTNGRVHLLAIVPKQQFNAFGGVQATIEQEARDRAEVLANAAAGELISEGALMPQISVLVGEGRQVIAEYLGQHPEVAALVLGAASAAPGPLVSHFSTHAGDMPCPLFIVPGSLGPEEIDRLS